MQDSNLGSLRHQIVSKLNAHSQTDWVIEDHAKNLNSTALPYDEWAFNPLDFTARISSPLVLTIYIFVVWFDSALAQWSDLESKGDMFCFCAECRIINLISHINHMNICIYISCIYIYYCEWRRHIENISPYWSRVNSNYERIASRVGSQFRTRASKSQRLIPPTVMSDGLTIRSWLVCQKCFGTSWTVSLIEQFD